MVKVNDALLKKCTYTKDLGTVKELTLTNKDADDIEGIQSMGSLRELNLAFNKIRNLSPLASCGDLVYLNLMHNQIRSLKGLETIHTLKILKVSNNSIKSITPISELTNIEELWLHNNSIVNIKELDKLRPLKKLSHLWFLPNQCCSKLSSRDYRRMILLMIPSLQVLDTQLISESEKEVLSLLAEEVEQKQAIEEIQERNSLLPNESLKINNENGKTKNSVNVGKQKEKESKHSKAKDSKISSSQTRFRNVKAANKMSDSVKYGTGELMSTVMNMLPNFEPTKEQREVMKNTKGQGCFRGLVKKDEPKHSNGINLTTTIKCRAALSDPKAHMIGFESKYPGSSMAVMVHHDGSAIAKWPGEQLALSIDSDILDGADGKNYTLFAAYRSTGITAISFDTQGNGFVNFPNGQVLLSYSRQKDHGVQYDNKGKIIKTWSCKDAKSVADSVEIILDTNLAFRHKMPECIPEIYFACNGVKHKFVQGFNPAHNCWEDENDPSAPSFMKTIDSRNPVLGALPVASPLPLTPKKSATELSLSDISSIADSLKQLNSDLMSGSILNTS